MDENDSLIEGALASYPLAPLPAGFTQGVRTKVARYESGFNLDFLDYALPAFFGLFSLISVFVLFSILHSLDPQWFIRLQLIQRDLQLDLVNFPNWPVLFFALFAAAGMGLSILVGLIALAPKRTELRQNA